ncbi:hypothetical protein NY96_00440 [Xanthomonas citri pv. fuscans]|uniref:ANTAR domain-containing protein n=1 Tax=Xanthomonas hortorum pv. vitians TaxID=83224 RepID=A0AAW8ZN60_9XANT|nr:hypothetical protein [Xanthomonas citri]MDV7248907.1 hypothetical protein [Xanthomonas hortorum pv. vitians]CAD7741779.1 hypothetical protein LMG31884_48030 [Xanthomonas hydrangeae]KGP23795.1 hypothetical protein NY68_16620 [Xanthomonas citri pv. fuscans]KGT57572.1 hypothetical protein NY96_00440 [Xanthomonas citri pv. fuscans]CAD7741783.1 hypothetical protein LMG31884_48030 [Xanthomonas hydrangeae]
MSGQKENVLQLGRGMASYEFTAQEVADAMETLRCHNRSLSDAILWQMESAMLAVARENGND